TGLHAAFLKDNALARLVQISHESVDHDVADEADPGLSDTFATKVFVCILRWSQKQVSNGIGDETVNFLGHGAIETAQTSLDMRYSNAEFYSDQGAGERRVHIANHHEPIGFLSQHDFFKGEHDMGGLGCMG